MAGAQDRAGLIGAFEFVAVSHSPVAEMNLESSICGLDWADSVLYPEVLFVWSASASCFVKCGAMCSVYHVCFCYIHICIISHLALYLLTN